jgi:hypothetical protein
MKLYSLLTLGFLSCFNIVMAQETKNQNKGGYDQNPFRQMYQEMATPNAYRAASGAPGPMYYQQKADYKMKIFLDEVNDKVTGSETITYHNNSQESLEYLWVQLDQNINEKDGKSQLTRGGRVSEINTPDQFARNYMRENFDGGYNIVKVTSKGKNLKYTINQTMMRIDLEKPLAPGKSFTFDIDWWYKINNYRIDGGRSGYELLEDGNKIFVVAQFFPRMAVYNDVEGWQNMQFWGSGEFALPFGDYEVEITVPSDHIMEATGELQNRAQVLTKTEASRYKEAEKSFDKPVIVVTQAEADKKRKVTSNAQNTTWKFKAKNVRDFAFATSRTFIYDAMAVKTGNTTTMAISVYPPEANPLWEDYSTRAVAHTLTEYAKYTFDYPYPKAVSVSAEDQGMEYPMICWNYGRPDKDGNTPDRIKYGMISVIIHEVGHNFFPMIVNSDERQWTWMDEGLNTFLEYLAEQTFEKNYPSRRGSAKSIIPYMKGSQDFLEPIMVNSEVIHQFGNNAYAKPAAGLNILREVVMGPELFDHAFKTYAQRWKFKHPTPEDFFRTMEDASAVDLDWFWRGWFYSTQYVDLGIKNVNQYKVTQNVPVNLSDRFERIKTFYPEAKSATDYFVFLEKENQSEIAPFDANSIESISNYVNNLNDYEKARITKNPKYFTEVEFELIGDLIMPILLEIEYEDGTIEEQKLPEQVWRKNNKTFSKMLATDKKIKKLTIDKNELTADIDTSNNVWPKVNTPSKFDTLR